MDTDEEHRRKPWVRGGVQGRLLEEVVQNCFEVQGSLCEKGLRKLLHEASAAMPPWTAFPNLRGSREPRSLEGSLNGVGDMISCAG